MSLRPDTAHYAVECENISRYFPPATWALKDASLRIAPGESVAITGASGSGKSTLLSIIGLLDQPTEGQLHILGENMSRANDRTRTRARKEHIAFVFQAYHLIQHLTALENIVHTLTMRGISTHDAQERALQALSQVGLDHRLHEYPKNMSGGEQQRVAVARALACRPAILLCDEPTGNLDTENSHRVLDLLLSGSTDRQSLVIITHEPDIAQRCDRQIYICDGRIMSDSAAQITTHNDRREERDHG